MEKCYNINCVLNQILIEEKSEIQDESIK